MTEVGKFYFCYLLFYLIFTLLICLVCIHSMSHSTFHFTANDFSSSFQWRFPSQVNKGQDYRGFDSIYSTVEV